MADKIKDYYDIPFAHRLGDMLLQAEPGFDRAAYAAALPGNYEELEFRGRQDAIADMLEAALSGSYAYHLQVFERIQGPPLQGETGMFQDNWWLASLGRYVERHANDDPQATLRFLHGFTQRHTGEYAVRPVLMNDPEGTMRVLLDWSADDSVHVRRLASEGMRIALPWAPRTFAALSQPDLYRQILTRLKDDPSRFVQKSVGNNLNDLYRLAPQEAQVLVDLWQQQPLSKAAQWVLRHGQRSLRKEEKA